MKLLILGGTGVISRAIVAEALKKNFDVTIVNRGTRKLDFSGDVRTIIADRTQKADFAAKLAAETPDVVIDMICFHRDDAEQTLALFGGKARQIIFTSSVAAYDRPYKSIPIQEDRETLTASSTFEYGFSKAEFERYLQTRMGKIPSGITIIRPSLTFGPGARNFGTLRQNINVVRRIKQGKPLVLIGEGKFPWSFTYVDDLAAGFVAACGNEKTYNDHFQILNNEVVVWEDLYRKVGEIVGKEPKLVYVPSVLLRNMDEKLMGHLFYEKAYFSVFSTEKFQCAAPEWQPKYTYKEGIAKVIESWEAEGLAFDEEKEQLEDKICEFYADFAQNLAGLNTGTPFAHAFK